MCLLHKGGFNKAALSLAQKATFFLPNKTMCCFPAELSSHLEQIFKKIKAVPPVIQLFLTGGTDRIERRPLPDAAGDAPVLSVHFRAAQTHRSAFITLDANVRVRPGLGLGSCSQVLKPVWTRRKISSTEAVQRDRQRFRVS